MIVIVTVSVVVAIAVRGKGVVEQASEAAGVARDSAPLETRLTPLVRLPLLPLRCRSSAPALLSPLLLRLLLSLCRVRCLACVVCADSCFGRAGVSCGCG